jgi:hypothetical protein
MSFQYYPFGNIGLPETKGVSLEVSSEYSAEGFWDFKPIQLISVESATKGQ